MKKVNQEKLLRLWPGIIIVILQLLIRIGIPIIIPSTVPMIFMISPLSWLAIMVWWLFFSRADRSQKWISFAVIIISLILTIITIHKSLRLLPLIAYIIPTYSIAIIIWAIISQKFSNKYKTIILAGMMLITCGSWVMIRTTGVTGNYKSNFTWRWIKTSEDKFLAQSNEDYSEIPTSIDSDIYWPGFRGLESNGKISNIQIETDWETTPPIKKWRRLIGPGWSSFAVKGGLFYTQEQHGDDEIVSCYNLSTGKIVWKHKDAVRFWESNSGAGPRSTPTLNNDRVYTFGATGIVNALNSKTGNLIWSRNASLDTETNTPVWGFSSSPVVVDNLVIIAAAGALIAYDIETGEPRWFTKEGGDCYSSPHLMTIDGTEQIILLNESGAISVLPITGESLWNYSWPGNPIVQPIQISSTDILISVDDKSGIRRINVSNDSGKWIVKESWTSYKIQPYFNDSIIHKGYIYGFYGSSLRCINLENGEPMWKGGRYGRGQIILLQDQDLIIVLSEKGELALVEASSNQFTEYTIFPAIEGKTWNHPVIAGNLLLVRNDTEMAAFKLPIIEN